MNLANFNWPETTPETNAEWHAYPQFSNDHFGYRVVKITHAWKLEQERNDALNSHASLSSRVKVLTECLDIAMRLAFAGIQGVDEQILRNWANDTSVNPDTRADCEDYLRIRALLSSPSSVKNKEEV